MVGHIVVAGHAADEAPWAALTPGVRLSIGFCAGVEHRRMRL